MQDGTLPNGHRRHDRRQLRQHQIIDGPIPRARRLDADLTDQDRVTDRLDAASEGGVDMENILVDDHIGPEILDLREQDFFRVVIELRAEADLARQRPQQGLERRNQALQPSGQRRTGGSPTRLQRRDRDAVLACPGRLQPWIIDVDFRSSMARRGKISGIEIGDAEQAGIPCRHLPGIGAALQPLLAAIKPVEKSRIVRVENEDAHGALDRDPKAVILVDPGPVGAAGHVAPPLFVVEIPVHGPTDSAGKIDAAAAAEFAFEFYRVDRVAVVVTGTIGHEGDE